MSLVSVLSYPTPIVAATIVADWLGGPGSWSDASKWSSFPSYPNNTGGVTFDARIFGGTVTVDVEVEIQKLRVTPGSTVSAEEGVRLNEDLLLDGGNLSLTAPLTVGGGLVWTGGALAGSGNLGVVGSIEISGNAGHGLREFHLENDGPLSWLAGHLALADGSTITNGTRATVRIEGMGPLLQSESGISSRWENRGEVSVAGEAFLASPFDNQGSLLVESGMLTLRGGGLSTGTFEVREGAVLVFGSRESRPQELLPESSIFGTGDVKFGVVPPNGVIDLSGDYAVRGTTRIQYDALVHFDSIVGDFPGIMVSAADATAHFSHGVRLSGSTLGKVVADDELVLVGPTALGGEISGGGKVRSSGELEIVGNSAALQGMTFENEGDVLQSGFLTVGEGGVFRNLAGASFTVSGFGTPLFGAPTGLFENIGLYERIDGPGIWVPPFVNRGVVQIHSRAGLEIRGRFTQLEGRTTFLSSSENPSGPFVFSLQPIEIEDGVLEGTGSVQATVRNRGTILPGGEHEFGRLEFGNLALLPTSEVVFEVRSLEPTPDFDVIQAFEMQLDGDLLIALAPDAESLLDADDVLEILLGGTALMGEFDNVASGQRITTRDGRGSFLVSYGANSPHGADRVALSDFVLVPEPRPLWLLGVALGGLFARRSGG